MRGPGWVITAVRGGHGFQKKRLGNGSSEAVSTWKAFLQLPASSSFLAAVALTITSHHMTSSLAAVWKEDLAPTGFILLSVGLLSFPRSLLSKQPCCQQLESFFRDSQEPSICTECSELTGACRVH